MGGQEMIMNRKLKDGRYLHINQEYGWYIDKEEKYKQNILPNNKIQRSREKLIFLIILIYIYYQVVMESANIVIRMNILMWET